MVRDSRLLEGRHVLITGASRGIGMAIALAYAEQGATLYLCSRSEEHLKEVAEQCKALGAKEVNICPGDLENADLVDDLGQKLADTVDVLVNNAGTLDYKSGVLDGDVKEWEKEVELDLVTPMRLTRLLAPGMAGKPDGGVIINVSSIFGVGPWPGHAAYAASKWGLFGFSRSTFMELREKNIKVVTICPGFVETEMTEPLPLPHEKMIQAYDIAQAALLPFMVSKYACPSEIVVRNMVPFPNA